MALPSTEVKSLQETISEKLKSQIAGLIPDEVWSKMVEAQFNNLMYNPTRRTINNEYVTKTEIEWIIHDELMSAAKTRIKEIVAINDEKWDAVAQQSKSEIAAYAVEKNIEQFLKIAMAGMMQNTTMQIMQSLRNNNF